MSIEPKDGGDDAPDARREPLPSAAVDAQFHEVTLAIHALQRGDPSAADDLIGLVYDELRKLAHARLAREPGHGAGMTLDATALVHEAYLRVIGDGSKKQTWDGRGHFFGAAALAMRRILVERARHQQREKHGGGRGRVDLDDVAGQVASVTTDATELIALDEALTRLEKFDARKAKVVSLRYFAGLSNEETAAALDMSATTVKTDWAYARAWLHRELSGENAGEPSGPDDDDGSK